MVRSVKQCAQHTYLNKMRSSLTSNKMITTDTTVFCWGPVLSVYSGNRLPLPVNTVRADMTRTSLVNRITLFCFTCANNIWLVFAENAERYGIREQILRSQHTTLQGFTALCITRDMQTPWVFGLATATMNTASEYRSPPPTEGCSMRWSILWPREGGN